MRTTSPYLSVLVLLAGLVLESPASAQQYVYYAPPPPQTHSGGFYFRGTLGFALPYAVEDYAGDEYAWYGLGGELTLSLGLSLPSGLALHADFLVSTTPEPRVSVNGEEIGYLSDLNFTTTAFGLGLTQYFPSNALITAGFGGAIMTFDSDTYVFESELGGYVTLGAGKEWWLGPRWAVGLIGRLTLLRVPDGPDAITGVVPSLSASLSFD